MEYERTFYYLNKLGLDDISVEVVNNYSNNYSRIVAKDRDKKNNNYFQMRLYKDKVTFEKVLLEVKVGRRKEAIYTFEQTPDMWGWYRGKTMDINQFFDTMIYLIIKMSK